MFNAFPSGDNVRANDLEGDCAVSEDSNNSKNESILENRCSTLSLNEATCSFKNASPSSTLFEYARISSSTGIAPFSISLPGGNSPLASAWNVMTKFFGSLAIPTILETVQTLPPSCGTSPINNQS